MPEKITIDKSGANTAATEGIARPMLEFKNFRCARALISGIETMHMIKKGQLNGVNDRFSPAAQFYSLAF